MDYTSLCIDHGPLAGGISATTVGGGLRGGLPVSTYNPRDAFVSSYHSLLPDNPDMTLLQGRWRFIRVCSLYLVRFCSPKPCKQYAVHMFSMSKLSRPVRLRGPLSGTRNPSAYLPVSHFPEFALNTVRAPADERFSPAGLAPASRHRAAVLKYFLGEIDRKQERNTIQRLHKMPMTVSKLRLSFRLSSAHPTVYRQGEGWVLHEGTFNSIFPIVATNPMLLRA